MKNKILLLLLFVLLVTGCKIKKDNEKLSIVTTSFPCYDVARAITSDNANIKMLIKPGMEVHTYDPTPQDVMDVADADVFIYIGGESDEWVEDVLDSANNKDLVVIKLADYVDLLAEDGEEDEFDEHIWTSPKNLVLMINGALEVIIKVDTDNEDIYKENASKYIEEINKLDSEFDEIISNSNQDKLIFADRFPFKYFANDYKLDYKAAFIGCSAETEVSAKTLKELINEVNVNNIPYVFYLELSNQKIADAIIEETGCNKIMLHSGQNITASEFNDGITLVDIMKNNRDNLKEAMK